MERAMRAQRERDAAYARSSFICSARLDASLEPCLILSFPPVFITLAYCRFAASLPGFCSSALLPSEPRCHLCLSSVAILHFVALRSLRKFQTSKNSGHDFTVRCSPFMLVMLHSCLCSLDFRNALRFRLAPSRPLFSVVFLQFASF